MHASLTIPSASRIFAAASAADQQQGASALQHNGLAVDSTALLQGHKAVSIMHNGAVYRLQATKLGKLILTK